MIRAKSGRIIRRSLAEINPWAKDGLGENDLALGNQALMPVTDLKPYHVVECVR